jgi:adenine-specific DNA-methyltransferase
VEKIAALFPNCVTERLDKDGNPEAVVDFDKLRQELSTELVEGAAERYQFTWPDKRAANHLANQPTTMTLRPCAEESVGKDGTNGVFDSENLYIEGDNLDVLKVLRETYLGKVKMIYIDPPYNTGNDFVYNDDFAESYEEFADSCKVRDEDGNLTFDPRANGESNGRFHTDWLNMMYPRLKIARDLLTEDGVIFISIGDTEVNNLQKVCAELLGEANFVAKLTIITGANQAGDGVLIQKNVEYILVYAKNIAACSINRVDKTEETWRNLNDAPTPLSTRLDMGYTIYYNPKTDELIPEMDYDKEMVYTNETDKVYKDNKFLTTKGFIPVRPGMRNGYLHRWRWGLDTFKDRISEIKIFKAKEGYQPKFKQSGYNPPKNYHNFSGGASDLKALFGDKTPFEYPKSVALLQYLNSLGTQKKSIVLDFFSGSATTAHAVMKLNAEDGGSRKFIMVQLPEVTDENSEARKAGYNTICEIGKERIRRAGKQILESLKPNDGGLFANAEESPKLDIGFRVLKLAESNMENVYYSPDKFDANNLFTLEDNVKADRTAEDLLFQVMLELGVELSSPIEKKSINGVEVFNVKDGFLIATFDKDVNESTITEIAKSEPVYFVMRDASAANDNVLDNFDQLFRHYSPDTIRRIL